MNILFKGAGCNKEAWEMVYYVIAADGNPETQRLPLADKATVANIMDEVLCYI